ncbi:MAG: hypothetical protein ABSF86_23570 [Steroidobacteraceae bacterium]|jgi:hypothetical protein
MRTRLIGIWLYAACLTLPLPINAGTQGQYSLEQVLHYPYDSQLSSVQGADIIAWVRNIDGVRNVSGNHAAYFPLA